MVSYTARNTVIVNATDLEREFAVRAVPYSGGLLLLRPDDALALVRRSAQVGVPIFRRGRRRS